MTLPHGVLSAWDLPPVTLHPVSSGLINPTWLVVGEHGPHAVLQQLNTAIFQPTVHLDIEAVTTHLAAKGLTTPRLLRTRDDALWHTHDDQVFRLLSHVGTRTIERIDTPVDALSAGRLVGRFHTALDDLDWTYRHVRPGPHDTDRHAGLLRTALARHAQHRLIDHVAPLAEGLLRDWEALRAELPALPLRHIHGDLKISNVRFVGHEAVALIDLDTLARDTLGAELGDAMRSWCGTAGEDSTHATFDLDVFGAALQGYADGTRAAPPPTEVWEALVPSVLRICTELAMRFAADALQESYFGWNAERYATRGDHNLVRALGQANLARALGLVRRAAEQRVVNARM